MVQRFVDYAIQQEIYDSSGTRLNSISVYLDEYFTGRWRWRKGGQTSAWMATVTFSNRPEPL